MKRFIFDVDGTLTPSRQIINIDFQRWFLEFCYDNDVSLVTGSDYQKTLDQVGLTICQNVSKIYNCSGNDVWQAGKNIKTNKWTLPQDAHEWLAESLTESKFPLRTGLHFEHRPGLCNFSIVGRNANKEQRMLYVDWDRKNNERNKIASWFNAQFLDLEARPGGETGIDISKKGNNKSQILQDFDSSDVIYFFGDRLDPDGNDYPLAKEILDKNLGFCYNVTDWRETWTHLKTL